MPEKLHDLKIDIVMPSSYNRDSGETLRQCRTTMMLPPVFAVLRGLADKAATDYGLDIAVEHYNERTERGEDYLARIMEDDTAHNSLVLIPAKSFELPRAIDLARQFKRAGKQLVLGGPGITLTDLKTMAFLVEEGIPFSVGEGENLVGQIMQDAVDNRLRPAYWQPGFVDLSRAVMPRYPELGEHAKTITQMTALDTSRSCPFNCSYCCVVKLEGHKGSFDRSRMVDACVAWIEEAYARGFSDIFLTDNNFRKSFIYSALKSPLKLLNSDLKRRYGKELSLFVQVDAKPDIMDEVDDLVEMGVKAVFQGYETNDPIVLARARKKQNKPETYQMIADKFRGRGVMVTAGVMIGFEPQTRESIQYDTKTFAKLLDLGYPFVVIPLPGSDDFMSAVENDQIRNWDPNAYDGSECVFKERENMAREEVNEAYSQSFFELYPEQNNHADEQKKPLLGHIEGRQLPARRLAELGLKYAGRPFHLMMDGIPYSRGSDVTRPEDSFRGIPLQSEDVQFIREGNTDKERYLSRFAWSPREMVAV